MASRIAYMFRDESSAAMMVSSTGWKNPASHCESNPAPPVRVEVDPARAVARSVEAPHGEVARPPVVVHHVDDHPDAARVGFIDERLHVFGRAVRALGGEREARVVPPREISRELRGRE